MNTTNEKSTTDITTANDEEINFFRQRSNIWWDPQLGMKLLHSMNQVRIPFIQNNLKKHAQLDIEFANLETPLQNINIADIGCGGGILSEALCKLGANVTGIDACKELIEIAKVHAKNNPDLRNNINYIYGGVEDYIDEYKNKFDVVVSSECLEHVDNPKNFVELCTKILKPGGSLFITTINKTYWSWLLAIISYEHIFRIIPKGTHEWKKLVPLDWLKNTLADNNCETKEVTGFKYNSYYNTWIMHPDPSVFFALHAVKK